MLSRKDYKAIAEIVKQNSNTHFGEFHAVMHTEVFTDDLADYFAQDNPQFDRERFLKACGL